eukprot:15469573-Alexandrium_andersonii.AAC.1
MRCVPVFKAFDHWASAIKNTSRLKHNIAACVTTNHDYATLGGKGGPPPQRLTGASLRAAPKPAPYWGKDVAHATAKWLAPPIKALSPR